MRRFVPTSKDIADVQQPLSRDGYSNNYFDSLYGADKNPHRGTEKDRKNKKGTRRTNFVMLSREEWERAFGGKKKNTTKL